MRRTIPERARRLASELELGFARDAEFATGLNGAQQRLQRANDRLWSGLHPDAVATLYGEHPAAGGIAVAHNRSHILEAPDPLREAQHAHWTIHHAFVAYQNAAERRRQLAAEIGELARGLITMLVAAGWSEHDARKRASTISPAGQTTMERRDGLVSSAQRNVLIPREGADRSGFCYHAVLADNASPVQRVRGRPRARTRRGRPTSTRPCQLPWSIDGREQR